MMIERKITIQKLRDVIDVQKVSARISFQPWSKDSGSERTKSIMSNVFTALYLHIRNKQRYKQQRTILRFFTIITKLKESLVNALV